MKKNIEELRKRAEQALWESAFQAGLAVGLDERADLHESSEAEAETQGSATGASITSSESPRVRTKRLVFDLLRRSQEKLYVREIVGRLRSAGYDVNFETVKRGLTEGVENGFIGRAEGRYFALQQPEDER